MEQHIGSKNRFYLLIFGIKILIKTSTIYTVLVLGLSVLSAAISPLNAILYQRFIDGIIEVVDSGVQFNSLLILLLNLSLLNALSLSINGILNYIREVLGKKLDIFVTNKVLNKISSLTMETFDNAEIYNHINRAISEGSSNCLVLLNSISEIVYSVVKCASYFCVISAFDLPLALVSVLTVLPLLHISLKSNKYWYHTYYKRVERNRLIEHLKMLVVKNEYIKEIKLYRMGEKIKEYICSHLSKYLKEDTKVSANFLLKRVSVQCLDSCLTYGIKLFYLLLAIKEKCSLGTIILYYNSLDNFKFSYIELISQFSSLQNSLQYLESLNVLETLNIHSESGKTKLDCAFCAIEFRNVSFKYPGCSSYVVKNISVKFERGKTYHIVGFNGSGKTTLLKLLLRLYEPTEGVILIDGVNINDISINDYYSNISAIFQNFVKYPFSIFENVAVRPVDNSRNGILKVLDNVDMLTFVESLPEQMNTPLMKDWTGGIDISQGQWQKLAIARCMFSNSIICLLDEPFSSLDSEAEKHIVTNLREDSNNKLMIYVTHRFSIISQTDEIIVLENGMIAEKGIHKDLMDTCGIYSKLYNSQKIEH